jgi:hypothetical protein
VTDLAPRPLRAADDVEIAALACVDWVSSGPLSHAAAPPLVGGAADTIALWTLFVTKAIGSLHGSKDDAAVSSACADAMSVP